MATSVKYRLSDGTYNTIYLSTYDSVDHLYSDLKLTADKRRSGQIGPVGGQAQGFVDFDQVAEVTQNT